jgi:ATP synthase protein I
MEDKKFSMDIERSAKELLSARKEKSNFWRYANVLGVGGWTFVIPVVGGLIWEGIWTKKYTGKAFRGQ